MSNLDAHLDAHSPHAFWKFSLAVYARPDVQTECLALQDTYDIDVNLLLFAAWMGAARHSRLSQAEMARARAAVEDWNRDVVKPLRLARRAMKAQGPALAADITAQRLAVAGVELSAERIEQDVLYGLAVTFAPSVSAPNAAQLRHIVHCNIALVLNTQTEPQTPFPAALAAAALAYAP